MKLFKRKKENELAVVELEPVAYNGNEPLMVSVPEIKDYLVKEYERANGLQEIIYDLEEKLEIANEVNIKYEAAMVTIDEYSKRLDSADGEVFKAQEKVRQEKEKHARTRDELNSYKIRLNDAALTKEQIKHEIIREIKSEIVSAIKNHKGNLSKAVVFEIVSHAKLPKNADHQTEKGGVE